VCHHCRECPEDVHGGKGGWRGRCNPECYKGAGRLGEESWRAGEKYKKTRKALEERRRVVSGESVHREEILKFKLQKLEEKKNLYWHQRAKVH
jgi:hypothetical protein